MKDYYQDFYSFLYGTDFSIVISRFEYIRSEKYWQEKLMTRQSSKLKRSVAPDFQCAPKHER